MRINFPKKVLPLNGLTVEEAKERILKRFPNSIVKHQKGQVVIHLELKK